MSNLDTIVHKFNTHPWKPKEGKTAVLLIDLQEYFRSIISPILSNLQSIVETAPKKQIPLFFTRHRHKEGDNTGMLGLWWSDLIWENTTSAQIIPELNPGAKDIIIEKDRYSAFYGTDLDKQLRDRKITDLIIGGVMTNLCCETTARDAFVRDFQVFFLADGTSTVHEEFHLATLRNLGYGFATLLTCQSFLDVTRNWNTIPWSPEQ